MCFSPHAVHRVCLEHSLPIHLHVIGSDCCAVVVELVFTEALTVDRAEMFAVWRFMYYLEWVCVYAKWSAGRGALQWGLGEGRRANR